MIINFSIQNFGSIKDKQTLSFEADKSAHLENYYVIQTNGLRLLKLGLIYGANASGKTTVLNALQFLRNVVLKPDNQKNETFQFEPFLFDRETPNQNTILSLEFIQNNIVYCYEVELNKKAIVREKLQNRNPNKSLVYKRTTDLDKQFTQITFGSRLKPDKVFEKTLTSNTLWNNTVLGGFLKTNIEVKELKDVTDWFEKYLNPLISPRTKLDDSISAQADKPDVQKRIVLEILRKADFNISDISIKSKAYDYPVVSDFNTQKALEDWKTSIHSLNYKEIKLEHTVSSSKYTLPFEEESKGTQRYYGLAGILYLS
ncbi:MAG: AAA family ATPase, partial [Tannerella sp.]|nr:AAA family ATPase [Tannerella sp.]